MVPEALKLEFWKQANSGDARRGGNTQILIGRTEAFNSLNFSVARVEMVDRFLRLMAVGWMLEGLVVLTNRGRQAPSFTFEGNRSIFGFCDFCISLLRRVLAASVGVSRWNRNQKLLMCQGLL
mmetsp:Transcript_7860/g.14503  ORF Transcript_7860/g.14503 Transcript_7860/m.14503 type:complete len:123 (+) Transcript_7860:293-661(+)